MCGRVFSNRPIPHAILERFRGLTVEWGDGRWWERARKSTVLINWFTPVTGEMLSDPGCLRLIIARSSGYDHIDVKAAEEKGVCVANQPEIISEAVAEQALAGILAALRRLVDRHSYFPKWEQQGWPTHLAGGLVAGRRVGLLGAGRIAVSLLVKLLPFRPSKILYYSRTPKPRLEQAYGAERVSLDELFMESDILVNSLPLNDETRGLVTDDLLALLPEGAVYVNVGRGGTEGDGAVYKAWERRPDLFFVLDVHPEEPLPMGSPRAKLYGKPRIIMTPHTAGYSVESRVGTTLLSLMQAKHFLDEGCVWNPVNKACRPCGSKRMNIWEVIAEARRIASEIGLKP
ncbi:MAG: 2-hydroxyacid dehydrogenase [Desulfurococcales archaeon]|nr:2-hydroxyacid dehydrogenase [Desulfurococcales archaeon]